MAFPHKTLISFLLLWIPYFLLAQPGNDNCASATDIPVAGGGFNLGLFTSAQTDIATATLQAGESFAPGILTAGLSKKSIWYKFSIPTTRSVEVFLKQPSVAIADGDVGFAVYNTNTCLPGNAQISTKLTPIAKFASSKHPCLDAGDYYIQVSANNTASGVVFISLDIADPDPAPYDKPATASKFGKVGSNKTTGVEFNVSCQSIDNAAEVCLANTSFKDYTKSTWHTFTTPDFFDYFGVFISGNTPNYGFNYSFKVGYRLFEGDITTTPLASLTQVGGCDSLYWKGETSDFRAYRCGQLKTNKTYTVQLLYHKDFVKPIRFAVSWDGTVPTRAPQPVSGIPAANKLGILPSSFSTTRINATPDYFSCNALHGLYSCPKTLPPAGIATKPSGYNVNQNMSTFYSFTLANTAELSFYASSNCGVATHVRLYKQSLTANCTDLDTANIISAVDIGTTLTCLAPGDYVVQLMGSDAPYPWGGPGFNELATGFNGNSGICVFSNLGKAVNLRLDVFKQVAINKFSLNAPGAFEKINANGAGVMQPIEMHKTYTTTPDTLGCSNTVVPLEGCGYDKASFREFVVADSSIFRVEAGNYGYTHLFKGDANALAVSQKSFSWPQKITGLTSQRICMWNTSPTSTSTCITPGTFSLVSIGPFNPNYQVTVHQPAFSAIAPKPKYNSPQKAQDMGDLWTILGAGGGLLISDIDTFTCYDNPAIIDGFDGSNCWGPYKSTKLIYRQFYLNQPTSLRIAESNYGYPSYIGYLTLYSGKVTDGITGLKSVGSNWKCFYDKSTQGCDLLPAGWYTVVAYGYGGSFQNPLQTTDAAGNHYTNLGQANAFYIQLFPPTCASPKFNRPHKASVDTVTKKPYLVEYKPQPGHTTAYPKQGTTYTLNKEYFDCSQDTSFIKQYLTSTCGSNNTKVAFYVFTTTQESYINISTGANFAWAALYDFDVRTQDSLRLKNGIDTALHPCTNKEGLMEICRLRPGTYTLVIFVPSVYICNSLSPAIYIDAVGYSRFDHASNAYDFGDIKPDSTWYKGKRGDINPIDATRSPSNDFFYCTTGAQAKDPTNSKGCFTEYNPFLYPGKANQVLHPTNASSYTDRRTLWYTFTLNHPGNVLVRVHGIKGTDKSLTPLFGVYKSDEDGTLSFAQLKSSGQVDSTLSQGLQPIVGNISLINYCYARPPNAISFLTEACQFKPTRYYILVDNYYADVPNSQIEVEILLDSLSAKPPKFDHFSQASDLGMVNNGKKKGAVDNFTCATRDLADPLMYLTTQCQKTLWYKFTTSVTGTIRYSTFFKGQYNYYYDHIQLFRQVKLNDSSGNGLLHLPHTGSYNDASNQTWAQQCVSPGTYYILLPGCNALNEDVYPEIEIIPQAGDFCGNPLVAALNGVGTSIATVKVDCHTIGTDYGEFNQTLTCPADAATNLYKTSWYRLDVTGTDTLDITVFINEKTNAGSTDIKYRMMTGSCGAMQEQSCVQDALTRNTYECMIPGKSYYIQVFTPISINGAAVVGDIDLNISSVKHVLPCAPANNCIAVAEFFPKFDCTKDRNISITNLSTFGSDIKYDWDFGYNNQKSNAVSPEFFYPALTTNKTYTITLTTTNTACGKVDVISKTITIPARPSVDLGRDTVICTGPASIALDATSHLGTTYQWYTWAGYWYPFNNNAKINVSTLSSLLAEVTYNGCKARDTVNVWINPIVKNALQTKVLCNIDKINLSVARGQGEQYKWNTGSTTNNIDAYTPGYYWCDLYLNGCTIRDSFLVVNPAATQSVKTINVCQASMPYKADATISGASGYTWNDNSTSAVKSISQPGLYWVDISISGCTFRDTLNILVDSFKTNAASARICGGQTYTLPSGRKISATGMYNDSLKNKRGCDSIITRLNLVVDTVVIKAFSTSVCAGQSYTLPSGRIINTAGAYVDTARFKSGCDSIISNITLLVANPVRKITKDTLCVGNTYTLPSGKTVNNNGTYADTLKAKAGCDSVITTLDLVVLSPVINTASASVCFGKSYTLPSGKVINANGTYKDTVRNVTYGCDSLVSVITLAVGQAIISNYTTHICKGQSFKLPSGKAISTSGLYQDTVRSTGGCDSLISTIQLIVQASSSVDSIASICSSFNFRLPSGKLINKQGIYLDTLHYSTGCDSITYKINLQVSELTVQQDAVSICFGKIYQLPSGRIVSTTGNYEDTARYANGCDSLISLVSLQVGNPIIDNKKVAVCQGETYILPGGSIVNKTGIYADTVRASGGCDSLISNIDLQVLSAIPIDSVAGICAGTSFRLPSGKSITASGIYKDTLHYSQGCDSILYNISLSVNTLVTNTESISICQGKSYTLPTGLTVKNDGFYRDTIRYSNGCDSLISNITLIVAQPFKASINSSICLGQNYLLPSGRAVNIAGNYSDTVRSQGGCDSLISTITLQVDAPQSRSVNTSICNDSYYSSPSGKQWNLAGNYKDTLPNIRGCDSIFYVIDLQIQNVAKVTVDSIICSGQNITLPGGRLVTTAGTYIDTLRTQTGCDSIITTRLTVRPALAVSRFAPGNICAGGTAVIAATATGGTGGPFIYQWSGSASTGNSISVSPSSNTTYVLTVTDGCTIAAAKDSVTITVTPIPDASFNVSENAGCQPLAVAFNNSAAGLGNHWQFGTAIPADSSVLQSPTFIYQVPGTYNITHIVKTIDGCINSSTQSVVVYEKPTASIIAPAAICAGGSVNLVGSFNIAASSSWNLGNGQTSSVSNPPAVLFTTAGKYSSQLIVKTLEGCADTAIHNITVNPLPVPGLNGNTLKICLGGSVSLTAKDGISYQWSPAAGLSNTTIANPVASPTSNATYRVLVSNNFNCTASDSIYIQVTQPFILTASVDTLVCIGNSVQLTANGAQRYEWSGGGTISTSNAVTVKPNSTSTYTVIGRGADSCFTQTKTIRVTVIPLPAVNAGNDTTIMVGNEILLKPAYSSDVVKYTWTPADQLTCSSCANPIASPQKEIIYTIVVENQYQCKSQDSKKISLLCNTNSVFVPNTFTPNGDGMNDVWYPRGNGIDRIRYLRVYNRWGQAIFERQNFNADDRSAGWDGTFKGQLVPAEVYVYSLGMVCSNGQVVETKGNVMVVR